MRKVTALLLSFLFVLMIACGGKTETVYTIESRNKEYTIDTEKKTITVDDFTCKYEIQGSSDSFSCKLYLPDGSTYSESFRTNHNGTISGTGGWSDGFNLDYRSICSGMCEALSESMEPAISEKELSMLLLCVVGFLVALFGLLNPELAWKISRGWMYKNAEPSDLALTMYRLSGGIGCLAFAIVFIRVLV